MKSSRVLSNQDGVYEKLEEVVRKHITTEYKAPVVPHTREVFWGLNLQDISRPIILDLGCGTGMSTYNLAVQYPDCFVVGIDKSLDRLGKYHGEMLPNMTLVRADIFPFLHLCALHSISLFMVSVFYPNPWPKAAYFKRRIHGHPVFPMMFPLVQRWWLRTNWDTYAVEFAQSVGLITGENPPVISLNLSDKTYMTLFEKKYHESQHDLYEVKLNF